MRSLLPVLILAISTGIFFVGPTGGGVAGE